MKELPKFILDYHTSTNLNNNYTYGKNMETFKGIQVFGFKQLSNKEFLQMIRIFN